MDHIFYQIFKIILIIYQIKHEEKFVNPSTFKIKRGYYLEPFIPETMKLLGSTKSKITKDKNGENVSYLEITEVVSIHGNVVNNSYQ